MDIDGEMFRRRPPAVKGVNAAVAAEVMLSDTGIPLIKTQVFFALEDAKMAFVDHRHQGIFLGAQRAIAFHGLA